MARWILDSCIGFATKLLLAFSLVQLQVHNRVFKALLVRYWFGVFLPSETGNRVTKIDDDLQASCKTSPQHRSWKKHPNLSHHTTLHHTQPWAVHSLSHVIRRRSFGKSDTQPTPMGSHTSGYLSNQHWHHRSQLSGSQPIGFADEGGLYYCNIDSTAPISQSIIVFSA